MHIIVYTVSTLGEKWPRKAQRVYIYLFFFSKNEELVHLGQPKLKHNSPFDYFINSNDNSLLGQVWHKRDLSGNQFQVKTKN